MQIDLMTLNPYLSAPFLFAKNQLEMGLKMPYLMLCLIGFVEIQSQIARRWNQLIADYWNYLTPEHHLNPRSEIERIEKIHHQRNSLIQMIVRMKMKTRMMRTEVVRMETINHQMKMKTRMMRMMWGLATELQTGYHYPFVA